MGEIQIGWTAIILALLNFEVINFVILIMILYSI